MLGAAVGAGATAAAAPRTPPDAVGRATVPFHGSRQAGVGTPAQAFAAFAAFDLAPGADRDVLVRLMRVWTDDAARLTAGAPGLGDSEPELAQVPASLTVTVGWGPGALAAAGVPAPPWFAPLPAFSVDDLRPEWSGGDVIVQVCADDAVTVAHTLRVLVRQATSLGTLRWVQRGFRNTPGALAPGTTMRNLFGQVDETRNLDPVRDAPLIWREGADDGATTMVVRRIAMDVEGWDELDRPAREAVIGRRLADGAPLTGQREHDEPDLDAVGPDGLAVIASFAHIRRARTADPTQRFLRRSYNYDAAPPPGARADSGLVFVTFQADLPAQFVPVQRRLAELDLLNRWTTPVGSAAFLVPGGCAPGEFLGERLLSG